MKINLILVSILLISFFYSCSSSKKMENRLPIGVICDDNHHCEVKDYFEANINVMKKCYKSQYPKAIKNYDGHSIIVRGFNIDRSMLNGSLLYETSVAIAKYLDILSDIYLNEYKKDIKPFLNKFSFYKEINQEDDSKVIKKIFIKTSFSNIQTLGVLNIDSNKVVGCKYFNLNSFLERNLAKMLPPSFKNNLPKLLDKADKKFNKYMKRNFFSKEPPVEVGDSFVQKYNNPTKKEIKEALNRIKNRKPLLVTFCNTTFLANEKEVKCDDVNKNEIDLIDLMELSYLPFLESLDLRGSNIKNISILANLKTLKKVYIYPEQKNEDELEVLTTASPNLKVIIHGEAEAKRRDEINNKISEYMEKIVKLERKRKRTRNRRRRKKYQKQIDELNDKISKLQPELEKLDEFFKREEERKINFQKALKEEAQKQKARKIYHLKGMIKMYQITLDKLEDKRYKNKDDADKVEEIDKKIEDIENRMSKAKKELRELQKQK